MSRTILKKASQIGMLSLASRGLAFIREFLLIKFLGIGAQSDAFFMAFRVPNTLRKVFAEGAMSSVLVPALVKMDKEHGQSGFNRLIALSFFVVELFLLMFCVWVYFYANIAIRFVAPGFQEHQIIYAVKFLKVLASFILFVSSSSIIAAGLQSKNKFLIPAMVPAFLNIFYVSSLLVCLKFGYPVETFCFCIVTASVFGFLLHLAIYLKNNLSFLLPRAETFIAFRLMLIQFFPYFISMSIVEINFMIDMRFSSFLPAGSISLIRYAFRFVGLPLGVMAASFATVLLPHFSRIGAKNREDLGYNLFEAIKLIIWLIVPIVFLMGLFSAEIFETLYSNGPEMIEKIQKTRIVFLVFLSGLLSFSLNRVLLNVFYALEMPTMPFLMSIVSVLLNYFMNKTLIQFYGAAGIAAASVMAAILQTIVYLLYLYLKLGMYFEMRKFIVFMGNCAKQWIVAFTIFFAIYSALHTFVSSLSIDISFFWFNWTTNFFLHSFGLWAWVGPIMLLFVIFLYLTRKTFGIDMHFLDN